MRLELDLGVNLTSLFATFARFASEHGVLRVDSRGLTLEGSIGVDHSRLFVDREWFQVFHPPSMCFESGVSVASIACLVSSHGSESRLHVVILHEDSELMMLFMRGDSCLSAARIKTSDSPPRVSKDASTILVLGEAMTADLDIVLSRLQHFPPETNQVSLSWDANHMQLFVQAEDVDLCCMLKSRIVSRVPESQEVTCRFGSVIKLRAVCPFFQCVAIFRFDEFVRFRFLSAKCQLDVDFSIL